MAKYWPDKGESDTFGPITVTCVTEEERPHDTTVRTFLVSHDRDKVRFKRRLAPITAFCHMTVSILLVFEAIRNELK